MTGHNGWMWFGGGFMWLIWIVLVIVIVIVVRNMTANASSTSASSNDETPLTILKKRFARGEIDEAEYKRRAQELEK